MHKDILCMLFVLSVSFMPQVLQRENKDLSHMIVIQRIINRFACFSALHDSQIAQKAQLMRNRRLSHIQHNSQVVYAQFALMKSVYDLDAGRITQGFKQIRQICSSGFGH